MVADATHRPAGGGAGIGGWETGNRPKEGRGHGGCSVGADDDTTDEPQTGPKSHTGGLPRGTSHTERPGFRGGLDIEVHAHPQGVHWVGAGGAAAEHSEGEGGLTGLRVV